MMYDKFMLRRKQHLSEICIPYVDHLKAALILYLIINAEHASNKSEKP